MLRGSLLRAMQRPLPPRGLAAVGDKVPRSCSTRASRRRRSTSPSSRQQEDDVVGLQRVADLIQLQVPGYLAQQTPKAKGIDEVIVYCVNDGAVMDAWAKDQTSRARWSRSSPTRAANDALDVVMTHPGPMGVLGNAVRASRSADDGVIKRRGERAGDAGDSGRRVRAWGDARDDLGAPRARENGGWRKESGRASGARGVAAGGGRRVAAHTRGEMAAVGTHVLALDGGSAAARKLCLPARWSRAPRTRGRAPAARAARWGPRRFQKQTRPFTRGVDDARPAPSSPGSNPSRAGRGKRKCAPRAASHARPGGGEARRRPRWRPPGSAVRSASNLAWRPGRSRGPSPRPRGSPRRSRTRPPRRGCSPSVTSFAAPASA